jgi:hypothetical protein
VLVRWATAFLDTPYETPGAAASLRFWLAVTGSRPSARRGTDGEFLTLEPPDGDAFLRWQDTAGDAPGAHLDLHVDDLDDAAAEARAAGASPVRQEDDVVVLRSPAGLAFCLVPHSGSARRPGPVVDGDASSLVDQLCLDVPAGAFEAELAWWSALTGWSHPPVGQRELVALRRPDGMPLRLLVQRLGTDDRRPRATAHLDLSAGDRAAVVHRHLALGARHLYEGDGWTTLADPAGRVYCVTDRDPVAGP